MKSWTSTRADDWWYDAGTTALQGGPPSYETSPAGELLLDMLGAVPKLHIMLAEATPAELDMLRGRLRTLQKMVAALPASTNATGSKVVGFKSP